jgi:hypothetical protein
MPWNDLTQTQQAFLLNYLQASTWDFVLGAENSKVNKPVIAGFEELEKLDEEYRAIINAIPQGYAEFQAIESAAAVAYGHREDGDFDQAVAVMTTVVSDTKNTITALKGATAELRSKAKPTIEGLTNDETAEIDQLHMTMMQRLVPDIPSRDELSAAQADGLALDLASERLKLAVESRKKARLDFDSAFKSIKPVLESVSGFDASPFLNTPQKSGIDLVIGGAADLLSEAALAEESEIEADHLDLTSRLAEWHKTASQVETLAAAARSEIRKGLSDGYDGIKDTIAGYLGTKFDIFTPEDQSALQPVTQSLTNSRNAIETALSGNDMAEQSRLAAELEVIKAKMQEFGLKREAAEERNRVIAERRKKARDGFDNAFQAAKPALETVSKIDPRPFQRATKQKDGINNAVNGAKNLLSAAELAEASDDELVHLDLTKKLTDWNATATQIDTLISQAKSAFRSALSNGYNEIKKTVANYVTTKITVYPTGDQAALKPVIESLTASRDAIELALAGTDSAEQLRMFDNLKNVKSKLQEFERLREVARDNREKAALATKGVSGAQIESIAKLRTTAPDALASVKATITATNKQLGTVPVTTQLIADRTKLRDAELKKWQDLGKEIDKIKAQTKAIEDKLQNDLIARFGTEGAEADSLQERIEELEDDTSPAALKEVQKATARLNEIEAAMKAWANNELEKQKPAIASLKEKLDDAEKDREKAGEEWNKQNNFVTAAETKKRLLDAIAFGPLSPDRSKTLDPASLLKLTDLYGKDSALADHAATQASKAKNPASVIAAAETVSGRIGNSFGNQKWNEETARKYADKLVTMAGNLPIDMVDGLEDYLDDGSHLLSAPDMFRGKTYAEDSKNRTAYVGKSMFKSNVNSDGSTAPSDGTLDLDGAVKSIMDVAFHPESLKYPTPTLAAHMFDTVEFFKNSATAEDKIKAITLPTDKGALALLAKGSGEAESAITPEIARQEVVNAMLTPVYQGDVGSCFATAGIVKLRQTEPDRALDLYSQIATKGTFTPKSANPSKNPAPIAVVQNVPKDDNPIIRSLEYTVAVAAALEEDSSMSTATSERTASAVEKLQNKIKPTEWNGVKAKLKSAIPAAFSLTYNPEIVITNSNDGSSTKGRYQLRKKTGDKKAIESETDYVNEVTPIVLAQIRAEDMADTVTSAMITDLVKSPEFLDALKVNGKMPWELNSGGFTHEAIKVLDGASGAKRDFLTGVTPSNDVSVKTGQIMENMLKRFSGKSDAMVPIYTNGIHGFNALPNDPSLEPLKKGGPGKFAENMGRELVKKGETLKNADIPVERAAYMVEKQLRSLATDATDAARKALDDAILAHRPTTPLKPAALKALIDTATADYLTEAAKAETEAWKAKEKKEKGADPSDVDYAKKLEENRKSTKKMLDNAAATLLISELDAPQFMLADMNWGSGVTHSFYVICPDPETGAVKMYQRDDPGGTLTAVEDKWIKTQWMEVQ